VSIKHPLYSHREERLMTYAERMEFISMAAVAWFKTYTHAPHCMPSLIPKDR